MSLMKSDNYGNQAGTLQVPAQYLVHGSAKAWAAVSVSGGVPSVANSLNHSSVVDGGVGIYTLNFTSAMVSGGHASLSDCTDSSNKTTVDTQTVNSYRILQRNSSSLAAADSSVYGNTQGQLA